MEEINLRYQERVKILKDGPILYRADPNLPTILSQELGEFVALGVPDALVSATYETFVRLHIDTNVKPEAIKEYTSALASLEADIKKHPLYHLYLKNPDLRLRNEIIDAFVKVAPVRTITRFLPHLNYSDILKATDLSEFTSSQHSELAAHVSSLIRLDIDTPAITDKVMAVNDYLKSVESIIMRYILVIGFTPEGFTFDCGLQKYKYDSVLTKLCFMGLKTWIPPEPMEAGYTVFWGQLFTYLNETKSEYLRIFRCVFPLPDSNILSSIVPPDLEDTVELAGAALAALYTVFDSEAMQQMLLPRVAHMYINALAPNPEPLDAPFRHWAWASLPGVSASATGVFESIARWIETTKRLSKQWAAPVTILAPVISIFYTMSLGIYDLIDKLIDIIVYGLVRYGNPVANYVREYLYLGRAWSSVVLPGARRRPKSVWALLFVNDFTRLDPGTRFALSCSMMDIRASPDFASWESNLHSAINATGLGSVELTPHIPIRPLRLPLKPKTVDEEILALAPLFPGQATKVDFMDDMLSKWVQYNVPQGIDGQWFATPERVAQSILRYDVDRVEPNEYTTGLLRETAHALANKYPEMYKYYRYFTPAHAMRRLKWDTNMSPGLGFMGNVRTRKQLRTHGLLAAIQKVAIDNMINGIHPGSVAHVFVKEQVVSLEKLLKGKNIRTVTAMDLMANTMALPFSIELSRAPPPEAYILNSLPRSEGGYRPIFEDLKRYSHVIQADAHEFDSKIAPVITVDGLSELRSIGFAENPALPIISSQIKAHYHHMRHAKLVDLSTGTVFDKTGGLMTGQVNTSYDNRDAFRLLIISGWAHVAQKPPGEFWDYNVLGNAGDDDLIGTDYDPKFWDEVFKWIKDVHGVTVEIEQRGWDNISITALQPTPETQATAYYRSKLGMPTVTYGIRTEPAKLLLTKTEFKARTARLSDIPFRQAHIDSMVGTAYLSAYNPEIYNDLAQLYKDDMKYVLLRFCKSIQINEQYDQFGHLAHLSITPGEVRDRYKSREKKIVDMLNAWLKKVKWPSYERIFSIWVKPYSEERSSISKHYKTLVSGGPALPVQYKLLYGLVGFRESLYQIPNHVVRALPEFPGADISVTLKTPDFIIERFVWLSLFTKLQRVPTKQAFMSALREGPYAAAASPIDFLEHLEVGQHMRDLIETNLEELRAQAIAVTLVYSFLEKILNKAAQTPLLGIIISLYALATRDVNRLYATANHVYWLAEGRSSNVISNLMPADPYAWMKQLSVILVSGLPTRWLVVPGLRHLVNWAPTLVEAWVLASATVSPNVGRLTFTQKALPLESPWTPVIDSLLAISANKSTFSATIIAPTGSGKSTLFVALLRLIYPLKKIWLLHPTIAARDEYMNDFIPESHVQILSRGIEKRLDAQVYSVTAGFFNQIAHTTDTNDIVLLDEIHLSTTELWAAWWLSHNNIRICLTATPKFTIQPKTDHIITYPGQRRFKMQMTYVNQTFEQLITTLCNERPELVRRALIICPTLTKAEYVLNTLARLSITASILSSFNPVPARHGAIVATSIADQALTISPPPSTVIDLGEMLQVKHVSMLGDIWPHTEVSIIPVSQEVADQRAGRGGRSGDAVGFGLINAPRSPHTTPERTPAAVFQNESVVDSLLATFHLRNPLDKLNEVPGLLQFIALSDAIVGNMDINSLALAVVGLLYLSGYASWDDLVVDHQNVVHAGIVEDAFRVYSQQVAMLYPEADPIRGNIVAARTILENGSFVVKVNQTTFPIAAFMFIDGWLLPAGTDPSMFNNTGARKLFPSLMAPIIVKGFSTPNFLSFLANTHPTGEVPLGQPEVDEPIVLYNLEALEPSILMQPTVGCLVLYNRVQSALTNLKHSPKFINVMLNGVPFHDNAFNINWSTNAITVPLKHTATISIVDLALQINGMLGFAIAVSCAANDNALVFVGQIPPILFKSTRPISRIVVFGSLTNPIGMIVPPIIARRLFCNLEGLIALPNFRLIAKAVPTAFVCDDTEEVSWTTFNMAVPRMWIVGNNLTL